MGAWGALQAQRVSNPSAPSGRSEKGVAEQGTPLSCTPFPSSCSPRIPISGRCLPGGCCGDSCATCWEARREAGAQRPVHFCQGGLSPLHKKETVCFIQARKIPVLLPDIVETLQDANSDVKMKALVFLRNMMGHTKREEASLIALQLAEKLLPLFDDVRLPWEPQPCRWALCKDSCPSAQPCGQHSGRAPLLAPLVWPFRALGPFSHGCRSGPQLLCSGSDPGASPLPSATLTPLLIVGREQLLLKSLCPPPYQESSQVRELSISLFKDVMKSVVGRDKKKMKNKVQRVLLPLLLRMSDQMESVAKVQ